MSSPLYDFSYHIGNKSLSKSRSPTCQQLKDPDIFRRQYPEKVKNNALLFCALEKAPTFWKLLLKTYSVSRKKFLLLLPMPANKKVTDKQILAILKRNRHGTG